MPSFLHILGSPLHSSGAQMLAQYARSARQPSSARSEQDSAPRHNVISGLHSDGAPAEELSF